MPRLSPVRVGPHRRRHRSTGVTAVGVATPVTVQLANPHGVRRVKAIHRAERRALSAVRARQSLPRASSGAATNSPAPSPSKPARTKRRISRRARPASSSKPSPTIFAATPIIAASDVNVVLAAPARDPRRRAALHQPGRHGAGHLTPSGSWNEAGVKVGKYTFRSFPLPGTSRASASPCSPIPGTCRRTYAPAVYARNPRRHRSHRPLLVQALPQEVPHARRRDRRQADG